MGEVYRARDTKLIAGQRHDDALAPEIRIVQNWLRELQERVPAR